MKKLIYILTLFLAFSCDYNPLSDIDNQKIIDELSDTLNSRLTEYFKAQIEYRDRVFNHQNESIANGLTLMISHGERIDILEGRLTFQPIEDSVLYFVAHDGLGNPYKLRLERSR